MDEIVFLDENNHPISLFVTKSFNRGTNRGNSLLKESLRRLGCTKGIVVDKDNNVLCGNKTVSTFQELGKTKVRVIETTGDELIVVKRVDVEASSTMGMELSLVDNLISSKNLAWDTNYILEKTKERISFDPRKWGGYECVVKELSIEDLLKEGYMNAPKKEKEKEKEIFFHDDLTLFD